jgi:hypothetical protein
MANNNFRLIDEDLFNKLISDVNEIKQIVKNGRPSGIKAFTSDVPLDSADVMAYLHISRRTLSKYKKQGLPHDKPGKPLFWKDQIDEFIKQKNKKNGN